MDFITLLDIANAKNTKETINQLIASFNNNITAIDTITKDITDISTNLTTLTDIINNLNALVNNKVSKSGDTITGDLQIIGDLTIGEGEFSGTGEVDKINGKLKLFAPTGNTAHAYQWSVIDIINPGVGTQQLKMGITGGNNRWGQIEYTFGENAEQHVKLNFREDGLYVVQNDNFSYNVAKKLAVIDDILAKAVSKTGDTMTGRLEINANLGESFRIYNYVNSTVGSVKMYQGFIGSEFQLLVTGPQSQYNGGTVGLYVKKDGLYELVNKNLNKLATTADLATLTARIAALENQLKN